MTLTLLQLNRGVVSFWRGGGRQTLIYSNKIFFNTNNGCAAPNFSLQPVAVDRQMEAGGLILCIVLHEGGKWRTVLPVVSLHLPSLPPISTAQQLASHLATGKWYSARNVWEEMAGYGAGLSRGRASDKAC